MKYLGFTLLLLFAASCQFFETEKISTDTFYEEELKTIDWKTVDQYPVFDSCENQTEKEAQKMCFERALTAHLITTFGKRNISASRDLNDTVRLSFTISEKGKLAITQIKMDSVIGKEFPLLEEWIREGVDTLYPVAPAYKRGIPVRTEFTLPIIFKTETL